MNTATPEGIVLATDSRQSFRNRKNMIRIGSDNASKLFQINSRIGVTATGLAFLPEDGIMKSISKFFDEFRHETDVEELGVREVAEGLHGLLDQKYDYGKQLEKLPEKIKADLQKQGCEIMEIKKKRDAVICRFRGPQGKSEELTAHVETINLIIAGYEKDGNHGVYTCHIPGEIQKNRDSAEKGREYGAAWTGQTDVVSRIVLGFDPRIARLNFMQQAARQQPTIQDQLRGMEYVIQWGAMSLQDAIDFCVLMIQTTAAIQRFSDGVIDDPGDMPGVGGPVDVAVITPDKGFVWIDKKKLQVAGVKLDLDTVPDR